MKRFGGKTRRLMTIGLTNTEVAEGRKEIYRATKIYKPTRKNFSEHFTTVNVNMP
jgi:hypothetical protein